MELALKYYKIKDGYIVSQADTIAEDTIGLPDGYINDDIISDNAYTVDSNGMVNLSEKYLCIRNLNNTDWKMIRHRDQLASEVSTTLTDEQYQELLTKRQSWREKASE
mgnify:CR=1 FL=1